MHSLLSRIPTSPSLSRRSALLAATGWLVLPASALAEAPSAYATWPRASQVPGGVALLSLGPAAQRPAAFAGELPLLVLGNAREWTALVGIALSALPARPASRYRPRTAAAATSPTR